MKTRLKMIGVGVIALVAFSTVLMLLWNVLIPDIFGLTTINFWQAAGLAIISKMLFGGFPDRRSRGYNEQRERLFGNNPIHEKWMNMSPEEREEFITKERNSHVEALSDEKIFLTGTSNPAPTKRIKMPDNKNLVKQDAGQLFEEYRAKLKLFIRKQVGSNEDADDILQDVFYQLIKTIDDAINPVQQISAWLYKVARNTIINKGKKKKEQELPHTEIQILTKIF